jgi:hypothetical protein
MTECDQEDDCGHLDADAIIKSKWSDLDFLYGGILTKAEGMVQPMIGKRDKFLIRKAILVKLWETGKILIGKVRELQIGFALNNDKLKEWQEHPDVKTLLDRILYLSKINAHIPDAPTPPTPSIWSRVPGVGNQGDKVQHIKSVGADTPAVIPQRVRRDVPQVPPAKPDKCGGCCSGK